MACTHAATGTVCSARPQAPGLAETGPTRHGHQAPERLVIGHLDFETMGRRLAMAPESRCPIAAGKPHAVSAQEAASALVFLFASNVPQPPTES